MLHACGSLLGREDASSAIANATVLFLLVFTRDRRAQLAAPNRSIDRSNREIGDLDPREPVDRTFVLHPTPLTRFFVLDSTRS